MNALYLGTFEIAKKWTLSIRNWGKVRGELEIMYAATDDVSLNNMPRRNTPRFFWVLLTCSFIFAIK